MSLGPLSVGWPTCWVLTAPSVHSSPTRSLRGSLSGLTHLAGCLAAIRPGRAPGASDFLPCTLAVLAHACSSHPRPLLALLLPLHRPTWGFGAFWRILSPASGLNFPVSCSFHLLGNPEPVHMEFSPLSQLIIPNVKAVAQTQMQNHVMLNVL